MNVNFKNFVFIFLTGFIYFAISMTPSVSAQASQVVFDEIEKFVSPTEEILPPTEEKKIVEPIQQDVSEIEQTDIEEQPSDNEEKQTEEESVIQNTETVKEPTNVPVKDKETSVKPQQKELTVKTPQADEHNQVIKVSEEVPVTEKESKIHSSLLSKLFNKCRKFFCKLSFDKIVALKETIIEYFSPLNQIDGTMCCKPFTEYKPVVNKKDFLPYYFLYPLPINNLLEKIYITNKIINPVELLPYSYLTKNYEVRLEVPEKAVTPQGTTDIRVLLNAPSPEIEVMGKSLYAKLVIDIRNNTLYKYDEDGFPLKAYLVATGARGTRTKAGLRIVTYKEKFPYKGAPKDCKRLVDPYSYGPYIIFMNAVNPKTGKQMYVDQFLHGNGNEKSIGRKVSHGCMRTNNNVMKNELSKEVNRGDYVLIINPDIN